MEIRKELLEALEDKLIRHGYSYVGTDILEQIIAWIESHELFKDFPIVLDHKGKIQTRLTLKGFYESR